MRSADAGSHPLDRRQLRGAVTGAANHRAACRFEQARRRAAAQDAERAARRPRWRGSRPSPRRGDFHQGAEPAHAALLQLDRYERLVLIRYLNRHFSTELERWPFIILDIIRHPDLDASTELAALDLRISAETIRLQGILSDRGAECAQRAVIDQLMRQRNAIELPLEIRRIEASNVAPERRAAQIEVARQSRRHAQEMLSRYWLGNCGGTAALPGQFVMPPIPKPSTPERPVYAVYSLDPPDVAVLADAAGIPPVSSGKWAVDRAGKRFAQQQAKTEQAKRVSEGRQPFVRQANEEVGQAKKSLDADIQALTAGGPCPNARDACDAAMKAASKRYQSRVSGAADRLLAAPVGDAPTTKRPSYAVLQLYDADGQFLEQRFPKTRPLQMALRHGGREPGA